MKRVANFSNRLRFCRKIAVTRSTDKLSASTNRKNDLGQIWSERNDAIDFDRYRDMSPRVVCQRSRYGTVKL